MFLRLTYLLKMAWLAVGVSMLLKEVGLLGGLFWIGICVAGEVLLWKLLVASCLLAFLAGGLNVGLWWLALTLRGGLDLSSLSCAWLCFLPDGSSSWCVAQLLASGALEMTLLLHWSSHHACYPLLLTTRIICLEIVELIAVVDGVLVLESWGIL